MLSPIDHSEFVHALLDILYLGNGFNDMLSLGEAHLMRPLHLYDINFNLIALSPKAKKIHAHIQRGNGHAFLNDAETLRMKKHNVLHDINHHAGAFVVQDVDYPSIHWMLSAVRIKNAFVGYLICPTRPDVSESDLNIMNQLTYAVSVEMQKSNMFAYKTSLKYTYFLNNLIEGHFESQDIIQSRLEVLNRTVDHFIHVICVSAPDKLHQNEFNETLIEQARGCFRNCIYTMYKNNLVLLVSEKNSASKNKNTFSDFYSFTATHKLCAGISQEFSDIAATPANYTAALQALEIGLEMKIPQQIFFSEKLLFSQLLHSIDRSRLKQIRYHVFEQIKEYDLQHNTEFLPTIHALIACDLNSPQAAAHLHIHRSSFFYRLKKIEELWNISITDFETLFMFEVAFRIDDFLQSGLLSVPK